VADIKLFRILVDSVIKLTAESVAIEKSLQLLMEKHLESFLGVRPVATEYVTGRRHGGRIDTLGLDENNCPVIIEYKRDLNENVINQGLFYLDWLMDHQGEFQLAVMQNLGSAFTGKIDWSGPRLLCIAGDFTKYDEHAVMQIPRNIELLRYRRYGADLLLLELVNAGTVDALHGHSRKDTQKKEKQIGVSGLEAGPALEEVWGTLRTFLLALGDDVNMSELELYVAFRRLKNFACVKSQQNDLKIWVRLDPSSVELQDGFTRDVTNIGHHGTGNLEIRIHTISDFEKAKPLLLRSYQEN
jgi:predicted transport protein